MSNHLFQTLFPSETRFKECSNIQTVFLPNSIVSQTVVHMKDGSKNVQLSLKPFPYEACFKDSLQHFLPNLTVSKIKTVE